MTGLVKYFGDATKVILAAGVDVFSPDSSVTLSITQSSVAAALFDDNNNALANPLPVDVHGFFQFNIAAGTYDFQFLRGATVLKTILGVPINGGGAGFIEATPPEIWAGLIENHGITPFSWFGAAVPQTLTDATTVTPDFSVGINFTWTIAGNHTLANPTNAKRGQSGAIMIQQDATGGRVITYGAGWGAPGPLSTAANAIDTLVYYVRSDGTLSAWLIRDASSGSPATAGAIGSSGLTMSTNRLLGRTTASTGAIEEVSVSSGLTLATDTLSITEATSSQMWTGSSSAAVVTPKKILDAAVPQALTDGATVTPDFNTGFNFEWAIGGSRTLANPTNAKSGQSGTIRITQDGTGTRVVTYGNNWRFPGGSAVGGVLSTPAGSIDVIAYIVGTDGKIYSTLSKAFAA